MAPKMAKNIIRTALLKRLKKTQGAWVSGQTLSDALSVSRTTVSNNIKRLRRKGYQIQAVASKGYRLIAVPDRLFKEEIRCGLATRVFGRSGIFHYDALESTNSRAKELADSGERDGTLIVAETQTSGRGRRQRDWISPPYDGIYLSMIARPRISPAQAPQITLLTAVALAHTIMRHTDLQLEINWPNDLLINGRKVAGILTELRTEMDLVDYVIIGIGLNVNTSREALKAVKNQKVTSLALETGSRLSRLVLLRRFLAEFETHYNLLGTPDFEPTLTHWKALTNIMGKYISVDVAGHTYQGQVVDVEKNGALVLETEQGERRRIFSGDLQTKKNNYFLDSTPDNNKSFKG